MSRDLELARQRMKDEAEARIHALPMQQGDVIRTCADISLARSLGYDPQTSIEVGIKRFVEWYTKTASQARALCV